MKKPDRLRARRIRLQGLPKNWRSLLKNAGTYYQVDTGAIHEVRVAFDEASGFYLVEWDMPKARLRVLDRKGRPKRKLRVMLRESWLRSQGIRKTKRAAVRAALARLRRNIRFFEQRARYVARLLERLERKHAGVLH